MSSAKSISPGAALLRTSRLFSLPPSNLNPARSHDTFGSPTATLPTPTHQAITTPNSSRKLGDWGLKRPFPLKTTTKSSTPMINVKQIDTVEHVTDFTSAAKHGLTLRKFQELNIPVTMPAMDKTSHMAQERSVFEEDGDFTAVDTGKERLVQDKRWKFRGPWLPGMSSGEFQKWLSKKVRHRRPEFYSFLKTKLAAKMCEGQQAAAADDVGLDLVSVAPVEPEAITEEQLADFLRTLRGDRQQLYGLVNEFLDLAPLQTPDISESLGSLVNYGTINLKLSGSPYAEHGPPVTHPSGGISYLRTGAYLDNHPVYGPQAHHPPTEARILAPRTATNVSSAYLGVGGFVPTIAGDHDLNSRDTKNDNLRRFNPQINGGAKIYVQATKASFDSNGKMILDVKQADKQDECIAKELIGKDKVFGQSRSFNEILASRHASARRPLGLGVGFGRHEPRRP